MPTRAPRLLRAERPIAAGTDRVKVTACVNGWCGAGIGQCLTAREAVEGLESVVEYGQVDTSDRATMLSIGLTDAVLVGGEPFRPYGPSYTSDELRTEILNRVEAKD